MAVKRVVVSVPNHPASDDEVVAGVRPGHHPTDAAADGEPYDQYHRDRSCRCGRSAIWRMHAGWR